METSRRGGGVRGDPEGAVPSPWHPPMRALQTALPRSSVCFTRSVGASSTFPLQVALHHVLTVLRVICFAGNIPQLPGDLVFKELLKSPGAHFSRFKANEGQQSRVLCLCSDTLVRWGSAALCDLAIIWRIPVPQNI